MSVSPIPTEKSPSKPPLSGKSEIKPPDIASASIPDTLATLKVDGAWRNTCTATGRGSSNSSSICRRTNNKSAFSPALMNRIRTGNSVSRTFTNENTGGATWARTSFLKATSTVDAPWYVVPADDKKNARLIVSQIVVDALHELKMTYPKATAKRHEDLLSIRQTLVK
jgi:hypothetical protein